MIKCHLATVLACFLFACFLFSLLFSLPITITKQPKLAPRNKMDSPCYCTTHLLYSGALQGIRPNFLDLWSIPCHPAGHSVQPSGTGIVPCSSTFFFLSVLGSFEKSKTPLQRHRELLLYRKHWKVFPEGLRPSRFNSADISGCWVTTQICPPNRKGIALGELEKHWGYKSMLLHWH